MKMFPSFSVITIETAKKEDFSDRVRQELVVQGAAAKERCCNNGYLKAGKPWEM